jgi:hypothetical protein
MTTSRVNSATSNNQNDRIPENGLTAGETQPLVFLDAKSAFGIQINTRKIAAVYSCGKIVR